MCKPKKWPPVVKLAISGLMLLCFRDRFDPRNSLPLKYFEVITVLTVCKPQILLSHSSQFLKNHEA